MSDWEYGDVEYCEEHIHISDSSCEECANETQYYYAPTTMTILVPIEVEYHSATDTVYGFKQPGLDQVEKSLILAILNKCPWNCINGTIVDEVNMLMSVCPLCKGKRQ